MFFSKIQRVGYDMSVDNNDPVLIFVVNLFVVDSPVVRFR